MGILLGLNAILWISGFLLPGPMTFLAWRGWFKTKNSAPAKPWRRKTSQIALCLLSVGMVLWVYASVRIYFGADLFESLTAHAGAFGAAILIIPSALAERKTGIWLILGALGLLFFFGVSTGEVAI